MKCTDCPIHQEGCLVNCMKGRGRFGGIMLVGEAPGAEEDKAGRVFVGRAGQLLDALLKDTGLAQYRIWKTNACRCRPAGNRTPKIDEVRACRKHLDREISIVKPEMIIALGRTPIQSLTDNHLASVRNYRAVRGEYKGIPVFYTYHPSAVLHDNGVLKHITEDLKQAHDWYMKGCPKVLDKDDYEIYPLSDLRKIQHFHPIGAVDIETEGFDPYMPERKIQSIAVATTTNKVFYYRCNCLPGSAKWLETLEMLRGMNTWIFHNAPYDMVWMTRGVPKDHWIWNMTLRDSQIALQFVDEHYPNTSLEHLSHVYTKVSKIQTPDFVKNGFPEGWDTPENRVILKHYNARDARVTLELEERLTHSLTRKAYRAYCWVCENIMVVVRMRHSGIYLNQKRLAELHESMTRELNKIDAKLLRHPCNHTSNVDLGRYLFGVLKLPVLKRTNGGKASVDKDTLEALASQDQSGFINLVLKRRQYAKIRDTYCAQMQRWGKIAHPRVFISRLEEGGQKYGANTGRVTTEGFVNLPRGEGEASPYAIIKRVITSRYGRDGVIVQADGSQMEMRVLADLSGDRRMLFAFRKRIDLHRYVASQIYEIKRKDVDKLQRQVGKHYSFRTVYGGTSAESARKAGIDLSPEKDAEFQRNYFRRFSGVAKYIKQQKSTALATKLIYSPIGRPFHLHNAIHEFSKDLRKAINSPIQSGANDFTTEAVKQTQKWIEEEGLKAHVILTVYDSVICDFHRDSWESIDVDFFKREVLTNRVIKRFEKLGWKIRCPIEWDVKIGPSLGEMQDV